MKSCSISRNFLQSSVLQDLEVELPNLGLGLVGYSSGLIAWLAGWLASPMPGLLVPRPWLGYEWGLGSGIGADGRMGKTKLN